MDYIFLKYLILSSFIPVCNSVWYIMTQLADDQNGNWQDSHSVILPVFQHCEAVGKQAEAQRLGPSLTLEFYCLFSFPSHNSIQQLYPVLCLPVTATRI